MGYRRTFIDFNDYTGANLGKKIETRKEGRKLLTKINAPRDGVGHLDGGGQGKALWRGAMAAG